LLDTLFAWASPLELAATVFGLAAVWLTVRASIWCWPTGMAMVSLYAVVFLQARLYSQALLQVVYLAFQAYGWWHWLHGGDGGALRVGRMSPREWPLWVAVSLVGAAALGRVMDTRTDAEVAYADAAVTVLSLVAQWLQARKLVECWPVWIAVNLVAIGVYLAQRLYATTALYAVFLLLAALGWREWHRAARASAAG
jgi:nicotinamide mononucleotide transporter